jgi:CDP-diacylglycerol---serine O-phosphatidyltransferase
MCASQSPQNRFSMLRSYTVADLFTLGNASCGTIAIFLCLNYIAEGRNRFFWIAFVLHFVALACDVIDGYWARHSRRQSALGADLDSLADVVSFGVAPAVKYFEGTPIPTSVVIVGLLGVAFSQQAIDGDLWLGAVRLGPATLHPLTLLYAISGTAMISTIRIPKP